MINALLIFLGCGLGGLARYGVASGAHLFLNKSFPYGTFIVNISGSFLMGLLFVILINRFSAISAPLRAFLLIGFLGGYTTFSSFAIETLQLIEQGAWLSSFANMLLSVLFSVGACWLGVLIAKSL